MRSLNQGTKNRSAAKVDKSRSGSGISVNKPTVAAPVKSAAASIKTISASVKSIFAHSPQVKSFTLELADEFAVKPLPGQFVMVSLPGYGAFAAGIASDTANSKLLEICIKKVGAATSALHSLGKDGLVEIRGPFGNGFDLAQLKNKDLMLIAGGTGMPPLRSLVLRIQQDRESFGKVAFLIGAKEPHDLLYRNEYRKWQKFLDLKAIVEQPDENWEGACGLIPLLVSGIDLSPDANLIMVGPPRMYDACLEVALKRKFRKDNIFLSLERNMRCGIGKCQHCVEGTRYTCIHGPVFSLAQIEKELPGAV